MNSFTQLNEFISFNITLGAIDGSVVTNRSLIEWNEVVPFAPFGAESNTSSYLQWVIPLLSISVRVIRPITLL